MKYLIVYKFYPSDRRYGSSEDRAVYILESSEILDLQPEELSVAKIRDKLVIQGFSHITDIKALTL